MHTRPSQGAQKLVSVTRTCWTSGDHHEHDAFVVFQRPQEYVDKFVAFQFEQSTFLKRDTGFAEKNDDLLTLRRAPRRSRILTDMEATDATTLNYSRMPFEPGQLAHDRQEGQDGVFKV